VTEWSGKKKLVEANDKRGMNILKYTREQIQQLIKDGIAPVQALRDWDIAMAKKNGETTQNIAYDTNLSRQGVYKVLNKLSGKV
jgi:DNA invertase Pin-like site-specific DNA recombinase